MLRPMHSEPASRHRLPEMTRVGNGVLDLFCIIHLVAQTQSDTPHVLGYKGVASS
jgi:hypothetical protein